MSRFAAIPERVRSAIHTRSQAPEGRIVSGSLTLLIGSGLVSFINLIYNVGVARLLGPVAFGETAAVYTLLMLISAITLSFQFVCAKFVARNETTGGKAAVYAGLCGVRRTRGQPAREDREFRDRHKPWTPARWRVTAMVALEDGRCIELQQDLDGKVDCRARDVMLGRDYSSDIMFEGAPDGSRWLGLDRRSFLATACVRQTELLQVKADASALQHHLPRERDPPAA